MAQTNERLAEARRSYDRGDFRSARRLASSTLEDGELPPSDREEARRLLAATGIDPVAVLVFAGTLALLVFLVIRYVL